MEDRGRERRVRGRRVRGRRVRGRGVGDRSNTMGSYKLLHAVPTVASRHKPLRAIAGRSSTTGSSRYGGSRTTTTIVSGYTTSTSSSTPPSTVTVVSGRSYVRSPNSYSYTRAPRATQPYSDCAPQQSRYSISPISPTSPISPDLPDHEAARMRVWPRVPGCVRVASSTDVRRCPHSWQSP